MKIFIKKIILFLIPIAFLFSSGLFLPATPRASKSLLFANLAKDSLLENTPSPRMIFVGGSNLSFGLNSPMIKDSLSINPINTAVHASIGVKYMLENTLNYIQKGDIVILALEYTHFFQPYNQVSEELFRTIFDVNPDKKGMLSIGQKISMLGYLPKFSLTKLKPTEYFGFKESDVYSINSFNEFGDADAHWNLEDRGYNPVKINGDINENILKEIKKFEALVNKKEAWLYITFPSLDEVSYENSKEKVLQVEKELKELNFILLGSAEGYIMPSNMMFNTHYHLNKKGVDYRTSLFITDFKEARTHNILYK